MKTCMLIGVLCVAILSGGRLKAQEALGFPGVILYTTGNGSENVLPAVDTSFTIKEILVAGNKRTRKSTILRELPFSTGDAYLLPVIVEKLEQSKRQLMNTTLFRNVLVTLRSIREQEVEVEVEVEEKWYFYPEPFLRVANGSFSQWNERGRKLEHLNYGLKLTQYNFSGRGDKMYLNLTNGYTKKVALEYKGFYLDNALKWSGGVMVAYGKNRELNYATQNNKLLPVKTPDGFLYEFLQSAAELNYRPAIKTKHTLLVGYNHNHVGDTVRKLNAFYTPASNTYSYPYLTYTLLFKDLDFNPYPTQGVTGEVSLHKAGFGGAINLWQLSATATRYWLLSPKTYFSLNAGGVLKLPFRQPYIMQGFLGYGNNYLQGYENYIVDGVAGGFSKATLGYNILKKSFALPEIKWFKSLRSMPVQAYVKSFVNAGYAYNAPKNPTLGNGLNNRMLYSAGLGLDVVLFTDLVFKFEWSFNQLGQNGLYLHQ